MVLRIVEGLIYIDKNRLDYETGKRYEVFGNFTRYIPVGSVRISAEYDPNLGYMVSGYKTDTGYTMVAINTNEEAVTINVALETSKITNQMIGYLTDITHKWEKQDSVNGVNNMFTVTLPHQSVTTFVGKLGE